MDRIRRIFPLFLTLLFAPPISVYAQSARTQVEPKAPQAFRGLTPASLAPIAGIVRDAMRRHDCPGAVVLIGHDGKIVYRRAFGYRTYFPQRTRLHVNTIFDLASLTKVIATTPAVMQLWEQGKIRFDDPVADYWPEFAKSGKADITVRELMTHYSGLPPDLDLLQPWSGYDAAMQMIINVRPELPPGVRFVYSDINFETMGELVRRLSGEPLNVYCERHIFKPLGMKDTMFLPPASLKPRIAPTQFEYGTSGPMLWGVVNDPTARRMGGVAGHAGLFSTADDLAIYAQMLLNGGTYNGARILSPLAIEKMTTPQSPPDKMAVRGLGWDIDSPFSSNRGELFPVGSYGHTGFTGPSLWIDPVSDTYVIVLSSRLYPYGHGNVIPMRAKIATLVAAALGYTSDRKVLASHKSLTGYYELMNGYRVSGLRNGNVQTGMDVLEDERFAPLRGERIGLITNETGRDSEGRMDYEVLHDAPGVHLKALFSPEHGFYGMVNRPVHSTREPTTGLPIYSLYGKHERPTAQELRGLNALVFDIQDVGVRFYTFITTLGYCMEAAAQHHLAFYVLDRPDPISAQIVEGPILSPKLRSFVGYFDLPIRTGMTEGELAEMYNGEEHLGVRLHVIKMRGYQRTDWFDETGLPWVNPSPNLRDLTETVLYPGVALVEPANVSVGRGTDRPFEVLGAPWINGTDLARYLNARRIQGVRFIPMDFTPKSNKFAGQTCHGVQIVLVDRQALNSPKMGVELSSALYHLYPTEFEIDKTILLVGSHQVLEEIKAGIDPREIAFQWQQPLLKFKQIRAKYLLYH